MASVDDTALNHHSLSHSIPWYYNNRDICGVAGARVVALYTEPAHARLIFQASRDLGMEDQFVWLGTESWASNPDVTRGLEKAALGSISVQVLTFTTTTLILKPRILEYFEP